MFQLRNFDVPLLVMISGISFGVSFKDESYVSYVWKRIKRLLFPTWIFLTVYFLFISATGLPIPLPDGKTIAASYLLHSGISYVWIIRVFLLVSLVAPAILKCSRKAVSHFQYFSILAAAYICYELLLLVTKPYADPNDGLFESTVLYVIPYGIVFAIGLRLPELSISNVLSMTIGSFAIFGVAGAVLFAHAGRFMFTQEFKYPPSIYYLSYALGLSTFAWVASGPIVLKMKGLGLFKPILFVAQNSIWVYLWHIPALEMTPFPAWLKYPFVFLLAVLLTFIQVMCVRRILLPNISNASTRRNLEVLFTG